MVKKHWLTTLALLTLLFSPLFINVSSVAASSISCQPYTKNVQLSPAIPFLTYDLVGTLCYKGNLTDQTLQVLIHGAGYNSYYWDFPMDPNSYSYVEDATSKGYATFNVDRIGSGQSGKPDGFLVNVDNSAYTLHQLVDSLRDGSLTGHAFSKIVGVGHSFGSLIAVAQASQFQTDYNALVLTGFLHNQGTGIPTLIQSAIPAQFDPKFASYPANYFSNTPGTRAQVFYYQPNTNPAVIATDEENRDAIALGLLMDIGRHFSFESLGINVPVLLIVGKQDLVYCGNGVDCTDYNSVFSHESAYFSPAANLKVELVDDAGHNLPLHLNGKKSTKTILKWVKKTL